MKCLQHIKEKAISFRNSGYSIKEICERLNRSKGTVHYWLKELRKDNPEKYESQIKSNRIRLHSKFGTLATIAKYKKIHDKHLLLAKQIWENKLQNNPGFHLFLMMYLCEGYKKTKHQVNICNSDPQLMIFANKWIKKININNKKIICRVQMHEDQNENQLISFWSKTLNFDNIKITRKSNSGKMKGRNWNSKYGVACLFIQDAYVKTQMDFWMTELKKIL